MKYWLIHIVLVVDSFVVHVDGGTLENQIARHLDVNNFFVCGMYIIIVINIFILAIRCRNAVRAGDVQPDHAATTPD